MKLTTRELTTVAVFGALWGLSEISLGSVLKSLNIPFSGVVLSAIGITIALVGRAFVPKRGTTFFIGVIATLLKLFSIGGVIIGPMVGIISEALLVEIVLSIFVKPSRVSFLVAGAFGVSWVLAQPFVTGPLLFGRTLFVVWLDLLDIGERTLGLDPNAAFTLVFVLLAIYMIVGTFVGWLGWELSRALKARVGRSAPDTI